MSDPLGQLLGSFPGFITDNLVVSIDRKINHSQESVACLGSLLFLSADNARQTSECDSHGINGCRNAPLGEPFCSSTSSVP